MNSLRRSQSQNMQTGIRIAFSLCCILLLTVVLERVFLSRPDQSPAPAWLPVMAAIIAAMGIVRFKEHPGWAKLQRILLWGGLLLMIWVANGVLFDFLTMAGLIGDPATGLMRSVDWPGFAIRIVAVAAVVMVARLALALPDSPSSDSRVRWYGYAAFILALPYPVLRTIWAFGGTAGLSEAGAAGEGFAPLILAIPWVMAAIMSLLLAAQRPRIPRRLLLVAGWSATTIVATISPGACWSLISDIGKGGGQAFPGMAAWVPFLFYGSWLFWAIAAGAATRSFQLRTAGYPDVIDK